jgi:hypothetical protein
MKMLPLSLFAAAAGITLLGATPPPMYGPPPPPMGDGPAAHASHGYPPCSRAIRDRCIQLYERGVANPRNLALNERLGPDRGPRRWARRGMMGPMPGRMERVVVARNDYPPCAGLLADRCIQAPAPTPAPARMSARPHYDREVVRLGERG